MKEEKLKANQTKCLNCGQIIESKHNYDFQVCRCGQTAIDGGNFPRIIELRPNK